jgi:hypothetical protein
MSYLAPLFLITPENGEQALHRGFILNDEPGIPDDTYHLQEWFCPNPQCDCNEAHLHVYAEAQRTQVLQIRLLLDPLTSPDPVLELEEDAPVYAKKLFALISKNIASDPAYIQRLRDHYLTMKAIAADPTHPRHKDSLYWARHGRLPTNSSSTKRKRRKR